MLRTSASLDDALAERIAGQALLDRTGLDRALEISRREGRALHRVLLDGGIVEEESLLPLVCEVLGIPFQIDAMEYAPLVDRSAVARLTEPFLHSRAAVPLAAGEIGPVPVLMADPADAGQREELAFLLDRPIAPKGALLRAIRALLAGEIDPTTAGAREQGPSQSRDADEPGADGPVIRFVNETLAEAVALGASDIHFESEPGGFAVRMRINGVLSSRPADPAVAAASVLARLKVIGRANVAERRLPQDARFSGVFSGRRIDFRLSFLPTRYGESVAMRVLDPQALRLGWDQLGFAPDLVAGVTRLIEMPNGLFLVTGPTGSGKTTTLYTALAHLNSIRRKIVTVEDPVEYGLPGIQQVQVQDEIGLGFARVLRAILRHDPDVIMVGEIRDPETAEIACRAAQVGRMVLSTLHTRSAAGAATRLVDLGVPTYIVADVLRGVLGQTLTLTPCPSCGGKGCRSCGFSGVAARRLEAELIEHG